MKKFNVSGNSHSGTCDYQQDAYCTHPFKFRSKEHLFMAVFDGHGSEDVSHYLAKHMFPCFSEILSGGVSFQEALAEACVVMGDRLHSFFHDRNHPLYHSCSGSTGVLAVTDGARLYVANVGDSGLGIIRNGVFEAITSEHNSDNEAEVVRVHKANGSFDKKRLVFRKGSISVTRAFGDSFMNLPCLVHYPDVYSYRLEPQDMVLLYTDGLSRYLDINTVSSYSPSKTTARLYISY